MSLTLKAFKIYNFQFLSMHAIISCTVALREIATGNMNNPMAQAAQSVL